jgi:hypothetical protein
MKNIIKIALFLILLLQSVAVSAQGGKDRVEELRVTFITKKLALTSTESEKFWPVYNEYNDKIKAVKKSLRQAYRKLPQELTEKEAEDLYQLEVQLRQTETDIHKLYGEKIKAIIGAKKLAVLRVAEDEFKRELIRTIKQGNE